MPSSTKGRRFPAETLSQDEVRQLIRASKGRSPSATRNRALIATLYRGGLRLNEALTLEPRDLDLDTGTLRVRNGKAAPNGAPRMRVVVIDGEALGLIEAWLGKRSTLGLNGRHLLFSTLKGAPIHQSYVRAMFKRLAGRAGIDRRVHAHMLRHTRAAELSSEGVPVPVIQQVLGHYNLATTDRYLSHVSPAQVINAMAASAWQLDEDPEPRTDADRIAALEVEVTRLRSAAKAPDPTP